MTCPACGSPDIHRSRPASLGERGRKLFGHQRPHRCHACGWRGWGPPTVHRHAATTTADGWEAIEMDLAQLDRMASEQNAGRAEAASGPVPSSRRHSHHQRIRKAPPRASATQFNRRVLLVLFVALLLLGVVVIVRACSGGARPIEPETGPTGQATVLFLVPGSSFLVRVPRARFLGGTKRPGTRDAHEEPGARN